MKKIINFLTFISLFFVLFAQANEKANVALDEKTNVEIKPMKKKKIIVFTCKGGGGHMSASNSVNLALQDSYEIKVINPLSDVFDNYDFIKTVSFKTFSGEDLYNLLLRNRFNWLINKYNKLGAWWITKNRKKIGEVLLKYLKNEDPQMIISVIPYVNGVTYDVAQKMDIPFLIIPTDLDTETFALGIESPKYDKFIYTLSFDDPLLLNKIKQFNIPKENIKFIGYPLRPDFFEKKDIPALKKEFDIPNNKQVVMLLMGAEGSKSILSYVKTLSKNKLPIHLIICIGRNEKLRKKISKIHFPKNVTKSIFGFTNRISDLIAISDVFITKPGTHSFCEGLQTGVPILIDQTNTSLQWEALNGDIIKKFDIGDCIVSQKKLNNLVDKILTDKKYQATLKKNLEKFKRESFAKPVKELVDEMLSAS